MLIIVFSFKNKIEFLPVPSSLQKNDTKPEVSNSNVHGGIHGRLNENLCNTGGVEEGNFIR